MTNIAYSVAEVIQQLHYQWIDRHKPGPVILFLHEGLGSVAQWKDFPENLCKALDLPGLLYDRQGHGKSPRLTEERDESYLEKYALEELPAFLKHLHLSRQLILFGHSDGGSIALIFASRYPEKIRGVITEAAHIYVEPITWKGIEPVIAEFEAKQRLYQALNRYHGAKAEHTFYAWANTWKKKQQSNWNISNYLHNFHTPVLAIQGKEDQYATEQHLIDITHPLKNVQASLIEHCRHSPHVEQAETVLSLAVNFIRTLNLN